VTDTTADLITPVILCGGKGTRLWPLSRSSWPKQFLQLTGPKSLFQETLLRVSDAKRFAPPIIVTNDEYRFIVTEQAEDVGCALGAVLLEPVARNTGPALVAAALHAAGDEGEASEKLLLVLASDHELQDDAKYKNCVAAAADAARAGYLVTFGIKPTKPATGFGYIETGAELMKGVHQVARFIEKPALAEAEKMLASGNFAWNSGMFMLRTDTFLSETKTYAPDVFAAAEAAVRSAKPDLDFLRLDEADFAQSPNISVDYAVFEHTDKAAVVPADITWSDLGAWDAVWKSSGPDTDGNVLRGPATVHDTHSALIVSEGAHVTVDGLDDIAVIASPDAVFVSRLSEASRAGDMVKTLSANPETSHLTETHLTCYRPWGGYSSVLSGDRFQVKRLFVNPGKKLSLQKHHHRSEHWVVVSGSAEVTIGDEVKILAENESAYIPAGAVHRLANPGKILLELIEVQTGSYLGEDDIIRIEDEFGRS